MKLMALSLGVSIAVHAAFVALIFADSWNYQGTRVAAVETTVQPQFNSIQVTIVPKGKL